MKQKFSDQEKSEETLHHFHQSPTHCYNFRKKILWLFLNSCFILFVASGDNTAATLPESFSNHLKVTSCLQGIYSHYRQPK